MGLLDLTVIALLLIYWPVGLLWLLGIVFIYALFTS